PIQVGTAITWTQLTVGNSHRCAVNQALAYCSGGNASGQLGNGTFTASSSFIGVGSSSSWQLLAAGAQHTCGIRAGEMYCWGENRRAQTGASVTWLPVELSF
ncbi:MAG TPA: hypothetical protein VJR89_19015, partial [Polyangiales bacterium]|nr:hypothetical protein [Polyangiales bacterium]